MQMLQDSPEQRKLGYSKLFRAMGDPATAYKSPRKNLDPNILARYALEKNDEKKKFILLAEYLYDPSMANLTIKQVHREEAMHCFLPLLICVSPCALV